MAATSPTWLLSTGNVINLKEDACCMCNTYAKYEKKVRYLQVQESIYFLIMYVNGLINLAQCRYINFNNAKNLH